MSAAAVGLSRRVRAVLVAGVLVALAAFGGILYSRRVPRWLYPSLVRYPVRGIDVSHHQGAVDWGVVQSEGIHFAFIKASEGTDRRDRRFARNWDNAALAGVARGAYHFFTFCSSGRAQADNFIAAVGGKFGELPAAADVEFAGNCRRWESIERIREELRIFLDRIEAASGRRPVLYFTADAHDRILSGYFEDYPTWPRSVVFTPVDLRVGKWLFWQFADDGRVPGISTPVDMNVFRGVRGAFDELIRER